MSDLEIRVCPWNTDQVSIISTKRRFRPKQFRRDVGKRAVVTKCPFCPGNEDETPPATLVLRDDLKFAREGGGTRIRNWLVRVFPNKYPALHRELKGVKESLSTYGYHEVLVESPIHSEDEYLLRLDHIFNSLLTLRKRVEDLFSDEAIVNVLVIKNSGPDSGASIEHPHLQIFANTFIPPIILSELRTFRESMERGAACPLCSIVRSESPRRVLESRHFIVEASYAPRQPYELIIIPKRHSESILQASNEELRDLAYVLSVSIRALKNALGNISYNFWFHIAPKGISKFYHWHIELQPVIEVWGGYERGGGVFIITVKPEDAAQELRKHIKLLRQSLPTST